MNLCRETGCSNPLPDRAGTTGRPRKFCCREHAVRYTSREWQRRKFGRTPRQPATKPPVPPPADKHRRYITWRRDDGSVIGRFLYIHKIKLWGTGGFVIHRPHDRFDEPFPGFCVSHLESGLVLSWGATRNRAVAWAQASAGNFLGRLYELDPELAEVLGGSIIAAPNFADLPPAMINKYKRHKGEEPRPWQEEKETGWFPLTFHWSEHGPLFYTNV